ncbi:hypothetical protein BCR34DRAFT_599525 [Clohesyomyces aquaticus]|uniref:Pyruvate decarboxylase n=1 Tax=Clohesyomyces aquaticus TaxID=1231657 RepID=A0A1Y1ZUL2_9PLEO|nr:hypothetical protein BCR34DRAFT_599525 [Clohesyomyces aquaticus]
MKSVLKALVTDLSQNKHSGLTQKVDWNPYPYSKSALSLSASTALKQDFLWPALGHFFRPGDIVIGETGTSAFGLIGYATGAIVGVGEAIKESGGKWTRPILVTGEGSMHLTVQAIADMLRWDLKPVIFVLNNNGYTVECLIHAKQPLTTKLPSTTTPP